MYMCQFRISSTRPAAACVRRQGFPVYQLQIFIYLAVENVFVRRTVALLRIPNTAINVPARSEHRNGALYAAAVLGQ